MNVNHNYSTVSLQSSVLGFVSVWLLNALWFINDIIIIINYITTVISNSFTIIIITVTITINNHIWPNSAMK